MTEHLVNLSDLEARAAADGRLRLIVRPVVPQPENIAGLYYMEWTPGVWRGYLQMAMAEPANVPEIANPLGGPGDVLLGREAWQLVPSKLIPAEAEHEAVADNKALIFRATYDGPPEYVYQYPWMDDTAMCWRPSTTMPRRFIRFRLPVVEAGVMRVGDIKAADVEAAGFNVVAKMPAFPPPDADLEALADVIAREMYAAEFSRRWRKVRFEDNPWVWFARVERGEA